MSRKFTPAEIAELGYYVYLYVDPRDNSPFYIGKGTGNRAFAHLVDAKETAKVARITEIRKHGFEPRIEILAFGLTESVAFKVEAAGIDLLGIGNLTNVVVGHGSQRAGRMSIDEIQARVAPKQLGKIDVPAVLIRINDSFPDSAARTDIELYDAVRGMWKMNIDVAREKAKYVFAVYGGIIREVYEVEAWLPAGSTLYNDNNRLVESDENNLRESRIEFVGRIAPAAIRKKYQWTSAAHHFSQGAANPVKYVGPEK